MTDPIRELRSGRYVIVRTLGEGAQGTTLEAVDKQNGELVAIKQFLLRGATQWKDVELAEREAHVLASLHHPLLPAYIEHFEEDGALCLVMQKMEGESLRALRLRKASLSQEQVLGFLRNVASVLEYLHGRVPPVIHRDIKPNNVILRPDGSFALVDFGSVRDRLKPEGGSTVVGTFGYMAPEQFQGRALPGSDIYAVGATALSMLTGQEPESLPHKGLAIDVRSALAGRHLAPALIEVLSQMLEPDPDKRPTRLTPLLEQLTAARPKQKPRAQEPSWNGAPPWSGDDYAEGMSRKDWRKARREWRHSAKEWRKEMRRGRRRFRPPSHGLPFLLMGLFVLSLVLRIAFWSVLQVALPVLLVVLSWALGSQVRRLADRSVQLGKQLDEAIAGIREQLRDRLSPPYEPPQQELSEQETASKVRVEPNRVRVAWEHKAAPSEVEVELEEEQESPNRKASERPGARPR